MILNRCPSIFVQSKLPRTMCFASGTDTGHLRQQLDNIHKEAESTRAEANSARLRFLRLSEAAEKLRQRATLGVRTGKENAARELRFQKRKVMQAMEKSKNRIEMLDELATKLTEKETELIGNVASDLEVGKDAAPTTVRFVSPKEEVPYISTEVNDFDEKEKLDQNEGLEIGAQSLTKLHSENVLNDSEQSVDGDVSKEDDAVRSMKQISSYEDFLKHIDSQLHNIEVEILTLLKSSQSILKSKENLQCSNFQHVAEILENVLHNRERIGSIRRTGVGIR